MAPTILAIRQRETGAELVVRDDKSGREYTFWRYGHDHKDDQTDVDAWVLDVVTKSVERETVEQKEQSAGKVVLDHADFKAWLDANLLRADIQAVLVPLVEKARAEDSNIATIYDGAKAIEVIEDLEP